MSRHTFRLNIRTLSRKVDQFFVKIGLQRLDRYIIKKFLTTYFFLIVIIISIAIIFDYNEQIDKITSSHATWKQIIFDYYASFVPYNANLFSPLFVFIAVIFFTSKLAGNSEIIAMKAAGVSFKRLLRPYMIAAAFIALLTFLLGAYVIPKGNVDRVNFYNKYIKKRDITAVDNVQIQVDSGVVVYISHFDNITKSGYGFSMDKFNGKQLISRMTAQTLQYDTLSDHTNSWSLNNVYVRTLKGKKEKLSYYPSLDTLIAMEPGDFFFVKNQQQTMTSPVLKEFIDKQTLRGAKGMEVFKVEYDKRFAMPFAAFILTIMGVSLSIVKRKNGMGTSIGVGIALSFGYILFQTISSTFAINARWPSALSVWLPNVLFAIIAYILYRRTPQ